MVLSRFCKVFSDNNDPASVILFSTKRASKVSIPKSMLQDISADTLSEEEREVLIELGILVKSLDEERNEIVSFLEELNTVDRIFSVQLVMNLDCNLDCSYCFEGSRKGRLYMTEETAETAVEFIKRAVKEETEGLRITFYGGEPLLSADLIAAISADINSWTREAGITYSGKLITNGTLLVPSTVEKLRHAGIKSARITLDGPAEVHDAARPFKGGGGSFRTILKNLKETVGSIGLDLSGNFTENNYRRFPKLFDQLRDEGLTSGRIESLQFYPVLQETEEMANCGFKEGCVSVNEPWLFDAEIFLREEIIKRGYRTSKIIPAACMMELEKRIIVNHDGSIYKCSGLIGRQEYKVGDIWKGIGDYHASHHLDNWKNEKCLACEYLPLCFGGCRYMKLMRDRDMAGIDCNKPYLDATLEKAVLQDIRYGLV